MWEYERELIEKVNFSNEPQTGSFIGIDEAGRGPLAGPVFAAAVCLGENSIDGINDSKKLSEKKRCELYEKIIKFPYAVSMVSELIIDEIGIKPSVHLAMRSAAAQLKIDNGFLLIDGNDKFSFDLPHLSIIKGDLRCECIAAASIIAKVERDRYMVTLAKSYPEYGFEKHKGYGTAAHISAIQKYGVSDVHRKCFMTKKVLGIC